MITYTYKCKVCHVIKEKQQKISDVKITYCTICKNDSLERIITSSNGFKLKGVGVYKNGTY
jgi:putative FmdB family regulatory protein